MYHLCALIYPPLFETVFKHKGRLNHLRELKPVKTQSLLDLNSQSSKIKETTAAENEKGNKSWKEENQRHNFVQISG